MYEGRQDGLTRFLFKKEENQIAIVESFFLLIQIIHNVICSSAFRNYID